MMANGDASSSDSAPSMTRPAIQQFKKQKEHAAVEGKYWPEERA